MPIYEYTCQDCGHRFERFFRSVTSAVEPSCPQCGGLNAKKGWSVFGMAKVDGGAGALTSATTSSCSPTGT